MFKNISMKELQILKDVNIIDIREKEEYISGCIPGVIKMPLSQLESDHLSLNKKESYYVVCRSGNRSQTACAFLNEQGYQTINVTGGMNEYDGPLDLE